MKVCHLYDSFLQYPPIVITHSETKEGGQVALLDTGNVQTLVNRLVTLAVAKIWADKVGNSCKIKVSVN